MHRKVPPPFHFHYTTPIQYSVVRSFKPYIHNKCGSTTPSREPDAFKIIIGDDRWCIYLFRACSLFLKIRNRMCERMASRTTITIMMSETHTNTYIHQIQSKNTHTTPYYIHICCRAHNRTFMSRVKCIQNTFVPCLQKKKKEKAEFWLILSLMGAELTYIMLLRRRYAR